MNLYYKYIVISQRTSRTVEGVNFGERRQLYNDFVDNGFAVVSLNVDILESFKIFIRRKRFNDGQLSLFFEDFANMLETGLTINHILHALKEMSIDPGMIDMYSVMLKSLEKGESLVKTFERAGIFPPIVLMALTGGEKAGNLVEVMRVLAVYFKSISEMKGRFLQSISYPIGVVVLLLGTTVYVSANLVPKLTVLLPAQALKGPITMFMLGVSVVVKDFWALTIVLILGVCFLAFWLYKNFTLQFNRWLFKVPLLGNLLRDQEFSLCFLNLYILLKSGITIDHAMRQTVMGGNNHTSYYLERCRQRLILGSNISDAFFDEPYFPRLIAETIKCGEETGKYFEYFERVYRFYNKSFMGRMNMLVGSVQPLTFFFMGSFLCLYAWAFLAPIYSNLGNLGAIPK